MNEGLKKVLETLAGDEEFAKRMSQSSSPEEAYEQAKTVADGFTLEDFQDVMSKLRDIIDKTGEEGLSEADLGEVAGGLSRDAWIGIGVFGGAGAVGIVASTAAAA